MSDDHPTRETMSLEEATISNMWEIATNVQVLERELKWGHSTFPEASASCLRCPHDGE